MGDWRVWGRLIRFGRVWESLTRFGRVSDVQGGLGWAHDERSIYHSAEQPFTNNGARVRTGSQKQFKNVQVSGQPISQTILAFPKQGIESHDENACFELFHFFGSQGRRREGLEGFGKVLGRFERVCKIWEGLGGFGRFGGLGGWDPSKGYGRVWEGLAAFGRFGRVWEGLEGLGRL